MVPMRAVRAAFWLVLLACSKPSSGDPTRDLFEAKRSAFVATRDLFRADHAVLRSVRKSPVGRIASAAGPTESCGSPLRGGELPWKCTTSGTSAATLADAERILGLSPGRLEEYGRVLPATQVSYAEGHMQFWLVDADAQPGTGVRNIVWSDTLLSGAFEPLGDGFYVDRR